METLRFTFLGFVPETGVVETQLGFSGTGNGVDAAIVQIITDAGSPRHCGDP
jgi:hypothetical protein